MKSRVYAIIAAFALMFSLMIFSEPPEAATGFAVTDRAASFFVGDSLALLGPLAILSLLFAAAIIGIYEIRKKR